MSSSTVRTAGSLLAALDVRFPLAWADAWDNVGLVIGELSWPVTGVLVTLDATAEAVERARERGCDALLTHHPPFLTLPEKIERANGPAGTLEAALRARVCVLSLHTNLDRSPEGASALPELLGLDVVSPLESSPEPVVSVVTYVPLEALEAVRNAMAAAGAGRLGDYEGCAFESTGHGHFTPLEGATPTVADAGRGVTESRLEMIAPPVAVQAVLAAARGAHPYEEPVIVATEGVRARGAAALGRVCSWRGGVSVADLAAHAARVLGNSCRVWGDRDRPAGRIAVGNGSAGSLVPDAVGAADTLLAGEVRYHDALAAAAAGLAVIDCGHDSTEWPLVEVLGRAVASWDPGVPCTVESKAIGWWTMEGPNVRG